MMALRLTTVEATALLLTVLVQQRRRLSTGMAADMIGRSRSSTYRILCQASRQAPITLSRGWWRRL